MARAHAVIVLALTLALATGCGEARTAGNAVAASYASDTTRAVDANALKPAECDSLNLTVTLTGSGDFEGGVANELMIGGSAAQRIRGRDGDDCLVGGAGADELRGDAGTDVCIGTAASIFQDCETIVYRP